METKILKSRLSEIDRSNDSQWLNSLSPRKEEEREFHDCRGDRQETEEEKIQEQGNSNKKFYNYTQDSRDYLESWIDSNSKDKVFLDYACGDGASTIQAAKAGASLAIGLDISGVSVETARERAKEAGVEANTYFIQGDCENTLLPEKSIDVMLCCGMLHHLDLSYAFPEMRRILAPGGKALGYEALNYNPLIRLYRQRTPELRTSWEKDHILDLKDLKFASRFFNVENVKYWHLTSILSNYAKPLSSLFQGIDKILTQVPLVQLMSWIFTFELVRGEDR